MKKIYSILTLALWFITPVQAWLGRGVIIALDETTKNYRILFVKEKESDETWTDFHREKKYKATENGDAVALDAITTQLQNAYDTSKLTTVMWEKDTATGDVFHIFLAKKFIPGQNLYQSMDGIENVKWSTSLTDFTGMEIDKKFKTFLKTAIKDKNLAKYLKPSQAPEISSSKKHHKKSSGKEDIETSLLTNTWPEPETKNTIHFYRSIDPYYEFANTYDAGPVTIEGKEWASTEHYFQSQKFKNPRSAYKKHLKKIVFGALQKAVPTILSKKQSYDKYEFSTQIKGAALNDSQKKWHGKEPAMGVKHTAMLKALIAKFTQTKKLEQLLLNTGDALIIEDTKKATGSFQDAEWGAGGDYKGRNILGQMLMWLRAQLKDGCSPDDIINNSSNFMRVIQPKEYLPLYKELTQKSNPQLQIEEKTVKEKKKSKKADTTPLFKDFAQALATI